MKRYQVVNRKRFKYFAIGTARIVFVMVLIMLLATLIKKYDGLEEREIITEYRTYELEYVQSPVNNRLKEARPVQVVYRYVHYR